MENRIKTSHEFATLDEGVLNDNNVLLTICEDSVESRELLSPTVLDYRLMGKMKSDCDETKGESDYLNKSPIPAAGAVKKNCEYFVVKEYSIEAPVNSTAVRHVPRLIAPKSGDTNGSLKRSFVIEPYKKRDDRRRATHNEVERRRRDKINSWIFKLKELIPESAGTNSPTDSKLKTNGSDSKSQILIRACEYIKEMQEELRSLRQCLVENDNLRLNNQQLKLEKEEQEHITSSFQNADKIIKYETPLDDKAERLN